MIESVATIAGVAGVAAKGPASDEYGTPDLLFRKLNDVYHFELDAAASHENHKCRAYYTKREDALNHHWESTGSVWLNPPYSRAAGGQGVWLQTAKWNVDNRHCPRVVALPICDPSTVYFRYACKYATEVVLLNQRVPFEGAKQGAKFASMLVIFERGPVGSLLSLWDWKTTDFNERERL